MAVRTVALGIALGVLAGSCSESYSMEEQMAGLEKFGAGQRDCVASNWFAESRPQILEGGDGLRSAIRSEAGVAACSSSGRLVEEVKTDAAFMRRYRCSVEGHDVEVSYTVRQDPQAGAGTWCEYAAGDRGQFDNARRYTYFREFGPI